MKEYLFTSESVSEGHPDKICDQISDAALDYLLSLDKHSRSAIECFVTTDRLIIGGEVRSKAFSRKKIDEIARSVIRQIGYKQEGFDYRNVEITNLIHEQSPDIAQGIDSNDRESEGAGDQGIMFGYACNQTEQFMPACIYYAHEILRNLSDYWKNNPDCGLGPDAKSQVTLKFKDDIPYGVDNILVSIQHREDITTSQIREIIINQLEKIFPANWLCSQDKILVNPTGRFVIGGPVGDAGLTGRKIIVDTYGGSAPHGGGAFSGKDPTKVDRSAAYMARHLAKNIVATGLAKKCLIQLSYAIGITQPLSFNINFFNTDLVDEAKVFDFISKNIDLSPRGIIDRLNLATPKYLKTASYGHFGRKANDGFFNWEKLSLQKQLIEYFDEQKLFSSVK